MNSKHFEFLRIALSIIIAILITFAIIFFISEEPIKAIQALVFGPFKNLRSFGNVIELMIPLGFAGLSMVMFFSSRQFNLATEGAFHIGGFAASLVSIYVTLPYVIHPLLSILVGGIVGAIIGVIPYILKRKTGSNEFVVSIMLNYVVILFVSFLVVNYLRDPNRGAFATYEFLDTASLGILVNKTRIHYGLIILIITNIFVYILLNKSNIGYKIRLTGSNKSYADYIGINTFKAIAISQILGGFIAGLGGGVEVLGMYSRFNWQNSLNYGWDGVVVAILAKDNPKYVLLCAFFLAFIRIGAYNMAMVTDVQNEIVSITQGVIIILVISEKFLSKIKNKSVYKNAKNSLSKEV